MSSRKGLRPLCAVVALLVVVPAGGSHAARKKIPSWAKPAVTYLVDQGLLDRDAFDPDAPMLRADFKALMKGAFGGGFSRAKGEVRVGEVGAALVRALDRQELADALQQTTGDGWEPGLPSRFGSEIVSRELGLRFNRPTDEESMEMDVDEPMRQADVAYSVWKALTGPSTYSADALTGFSLGSYDPKVQAVVQYALTLVGEPYVWAGEWATPTSEGYPYGAQTVGGFDCSGFIWYVMQAKTDSYRPVDRPYKGWYMPERSSAQMAGATKKSERLGYKEMKAGDVILFAPNGKDSKPSEVYHAGLYLGDGWMIHSSGSRAGVSITSIAPGTWWKDQIIFARRIII